METDWRTKPTSIEEVSRDIDYIIAIDESGSSELKSIFRAKNNGTLDDVPNSERFFTLTACIIPIEAADSIKDEVVRIKNKHWENGVFNYKSGSKRVCFHSTDIARKRDAFNDQVISWYEFIQDINGLMQNAHYKIVSATIDKVGMTQKYAYMRYIYDLGMDFVLERVLINTPQNKKCVVVLESRGKKDDRKLHEYIMKLLSRGTDFVDSTHFGRIVGVYFNQKWSKKSKDQKTYWALELADLCSTPMYRYGSYKQAGADFDIIKTHIVHFPNINGYGFKMFP